MCKYIYSIYLSYLLQAVVVDRSMIFLAWRHTTVANYSRHKVDLAGFEPATCNRNCRSPRGFVFCFFVLGAHLHIHRRCVGAKSCASAFAVQCASFWLDSPDRPTGAQGTAPVLLHRFVLLHRLCRHAWYTVTQTCFTPLRRRAAPP